MRHTCKRNIVIAHEQLALSAVYYCLHSTVYVAIITVHTTTAGAEARTAGEQAFATVSAVHCMAQHFHPLQRLATELQAQKRFLARHYTRTAPLQAGKSSFIWGDHHRNDKVRVM